MQNWMNTYLEAFLIVILPTLTQSTGLDFFFFFLGCQIFRIRGESPGRRPRREEWEGVWVRREALSWPIREFG